MRKISKRRLAKWIWISSILALFAGCSSYQKHFETSPSDYGSRNVSDDDQQLLSRPPKLKQLSVNHQNENISYSKADSDKIAAMSGIRDAVVVLSEKNAYVAIILDPSATGVKGKGKQLRSDRTIGSGQYHVRTDNSRTLPPNIMSTGDNSFNSFPNYEDLSTELTQQITTELKQTHSNLLNVFVSANQDFVNRMSKYAHEAWRAKSLQPYLREFNTIVQSHFQPTNSERKGK